MIRNAKIMKTAMLAACALFLISLGIGVFCILSFSIKTASIVILVGGLLSLALLFAACYLLNTREDEETQKDDYEFFQSLVPEANKNPEKFGAKLGRLTSQSTQYIALLIAVSLEAATGVIVLSLYVSISARISFYIALGLLTIVFLLIRSLFVKVEDIEYPSEMIATLQNWPELLGIVSRVQKSVDARPIHRVAVVPGDGCSVSSKSNSLGFNVKNTLQIGHYLLGFCDEEEMKALLAHEFSHISNKDTLIGFKFYANQVRWEQLSARAARQNFIIRILFGEFAFYYSKNLSIYHAALGKALEYHADQRGVSLTSPEVFARMLYKVLYLSNFRGGVSLPEINEASQIPVDFYTQDFARLRNGLDAGKTAFDQHLASSVSMEFDSHPSFVERLSKVNMDAFSYEIQLNPSTPLQKECDAQLPYYDDLWFSSITEEWNDYKEGQTEAQKIVDAYQKDFKNEEACWEYGIALEQLGKYPEAIAFYDEMKLNYPINFTIDFRKGLCLLSLDNEEGLTLLKESANQDPYLIEGALDIIYDYLMSHNQQDTFEEYRAWFEDRSKVLNQLQKESRGIEGGDVLMPVDLDSAMQQAVIQGFSTQKRVSAVYFLQKEVKVAGTSPLLVGFETGIYDANQKDTDAVAEIMNELSPQVGFDSYVVYPYEGNVMLFLKTFLDIDGAKIYTKKMAKESQRKIGDADTVEN